MRRTLVGLLGACTLVAALATPAAAHESGTSGVDETHLPVGKTTTKATVGGYWSCQTSFDANAGGAQGDLPWFNGDGTWDKTKKTTVDGKVEWPDAQLTVKREGAHARHHDEGPADRSHHRRVPDRFDRRRLRKRPQPELDPGSRLPPRDPGEPEARGHAILRGR